MRAAADGSQDGSRRPGKSLGREGGDRGHPPVSCTAAPQLPHHKRSARGTGDRGRRRSTSYAGIPPKRFAPKASPLMPKAA